MNFEELLIKTCQLEIEYLTNPNKDTAKMYNKYRNELLKNKSFYKQMLKGNIYNATNRIN